jgi:hypothetical protein
MLKYFVAIWNVLRTFGTLCVHLVHFFHFWSCRYLTRKICQPWPPLCFYAYWEAVTTVSLRRAAVTVFTYVCMYADVLTCETVRTTSINSWSQHDCHRLFIYFWIVTHGVNKLLWEKIPPAGVASRVARWFVFKPKIPIWVHLGGPQNRKCWAILWSFGIFYGHLVY